MNNFLELNIDSYGFSIDTAPFYFFIRWDAILLIAIIVTVIKLKRFIKLNRIFKLKIGGKK